VTTRSYEGLTAQQVVRQSRAIHPDWTHDDHVGYLTGEEPFSEAEAEKAVVAVLGARKPSCVECDNPRAPYVIITATAGVGTTERHYCGTCYNLQP
jgi:adenosylcobinamide amidohydrolase